LSKTQLAELDALLKAELRPGVKVIHTSHGEVDSALLLGLDAAVEDDLTARPSHHDTEDGHDHDDWESFAVPVPALSDPAILIERLKPVIEAHDILRLKGFLAVDGKAMRHVIQAVGTRINGYYDRPWKAGEAKNGQLVVIGLKGLDREAIKAGIASH